MAHIPIRKDRKDTVRGNTKNTREDWLAEARKILVKEGIGRVKIDRLAKNLNVTRGGFYWFFKNRQDLLDHILSHWQDSKNDPLTGAIKGNNKTPLDPLIRFTLTIIRERSYSPALDSAIRDWARTSTRTRRAVDLVDNRRITSLMKAYQGLGYKKEAAFIRARIQYFHQIGYYAMDVHETPEQRLHYLPFYFKQLTGFDLPDEAINNLKKEETSPVN